MNSIHDLFTQVGTEETSVHILMIGNLIPCKQFISIVIICNMYCKIVIYDYLTKENTLNYMNLLNTIIITMFRRSWVRKE